MLSRDERSCQAHCLDGRRSVSVAGSARGGNSDVAAADKRSAANRSQETNLQLHRPLDFRLPLSASPWRSRCAGDCQAGNRSQMASRWLPIIFGLEIESAGGRPTVPLEIRNLIREMSIANPLWGAPRIHGELLKLGIEIGPTSVAKYMVRRRAPPSQGWKTFLRNHADGVAAMDMFVVPTISFRLLYGLLIMGHGRRQILW